MSKKRSDWGQYSRVDEEVPSTSATTIIPVETVDNNTNVSNQNITVPSSVRPLSKRENATSCPNFGSLQAARSRVLTSGITFSEAKGEIWKERLRGPLLKQGFRYRKQWTARWVVLSGRILSYFVRPQDENDYRNARGCLELTSETIVAYEQDDKSFGFIVFPNGNKSSRRNVSYNAGTPSMDPPNAAVVTSSLTEEEDDSSGTFLSCGLTRKKNSAKNSHLPTTNTKNEGFFSSWFSNDFNPSELPWYFRARNAAERETWVRAIQRLVALIRRVELAPTLIGVGPIDYHYELKQDIGVGRFGTVKLATARATGNVFAVKVLNRAKFSSSPEASIALNMEIRIIKKITKFHDHPNICKSYHSFADNFLVFLVMEYLGGGSLQERIEKKGRYEESEAANVVFQIASALKELHSSGIVLCDLHPGNLLYERPNSETIKVVEFGRALIMPGPMHVSQRQESNNNNGVERPRARRPATIQDSSSFVTNQQIFGKPGFVAPEIITHKQYSTACDLWALGCITFNMITGTPPFNGSEPLKETIRGLTPQGIIDTGISMEGRDLIEQLTNCDRSKRYSASQVLEHYWVVSPPLRKIVVPFPSISTTITTSTPIIDEEHPSSFLLPKPTLDVTSLKRKLRLWFIVIRFCVRLNRTCKYQNNSQAGSRSDSVIRAFPPSFLINSRRSTETSSGVSQLELRNQWLTLDGCAQRVRSEHRLDEISPFFNLGGRTTSGTSGFTGVGVSSSIAGQLSELGEVEHREAASVRPAGPFLAALEAHLEADAGPSSDDDDITEDYEEEVPPMSKSSGSNPQGPNTSDLEENGATSSSTSVQANHQHLHHHEDEPDGDDEDDDEEVLSPNANRASLVRAWAEMMRDNENEAIAAATTTTAAPAVVAASE